MTKCIACPKKRAFVQNHVFLGHSLVHGADSLSVIANIEQDDEPFFDLTIRYAFKVYVSVPKTCFGTDTFSGTPDIYHNNPYTLKQYGIGSPKNDMLLSHEKLGLVPGKSENLQLFMGQDPILIGRMQFFGTPDNHIF